MDSADSKFTKLADKPALLLQYIRAAKAKQSSLKLQLDWLEFARKTNILPKNLNPPGKSEGIR